MSLLQVSYTSDLTLTQYMNSTKTNIVLTKLTAGVQYSIITSAFTNIGRRIYSNTVTVLTCRLTYFVVLLLELLFFSIVNTALFQIRLRPIGNCEEWIVSCN